MTFSFGGFGSQPTAQPAAGGNKKVLYHFRRSVRMYLFVGEFDVDMVMVRHNL